MLGTKKSKMPSNDTTDDDLLVERFIASFEKLDELIVDEVSDPIAWRLAAGDRDQYGCRRWRPIRASAEFSLLEPIYSKLPARFPPLFERLVLSYRWAEVEPAVSPAAGQSAWSRLRGLAPGDVKGLYPVEVPFGSRLHPIREGAPTSIMIPSASTSVLERKTKTARLSRSTTSRSCAMTG